MQRGSLKFLGLITIILTLSTFSHSLAQGSSYRLKMADSLFHAKRYTQSLEHYEEILRQRQYSPAMLLKMAYIHEGLNQMGSAIYYLNLYYSATGDEKAQTKISEVARKYNLHGYETSDTDHFWTFYSEYHTWISLSIAAILLFLLAVMYHTRTRTLRRPIGAAIAVVFVCGLLFAHLQSKSSRTQAVIASTQTYLMDGPSAGASVIDVVGDGHRVQILGKNDVWLKIRWDENIAYVKESAVKPVRL